MYRLCGSCANVVLAIEEGQGMNNLKNEIYITANFCDRLLESDRVQTQPHPVFSTELIWEIEKKDLRKLRSANKPIRVECYTIDQQNNNKERIGFVLLNIRSAQIIPTYFNINDIPFKWYKLIGVKNSKKLQPELFLSLTIRDINIKTQSTVLNPIIKPYCIVQQESETEILQRNIQLNNCPIKYLEDGYIQIGEPDLANKYYAFTFHVNKIYNLDILLPEALVFCENKEEYYLAIHVFGVTIKTKPFYKELHENVTLNEKVSIQILSNLNILYNLFQYEQIQTTFNCGGNVLGSAITSLKNLIPIEQIHNEFLNETFHNIDECFFKFPSPNGIIPVGSDNRQPYMDVEKILNQFMIKTETTNASGDWNCQNISMPYEHFYIYTLIIELNNFVWLKPYTNKNVSFNFHHPRACYQINLTRNLNGDIENDIQLTNIKSVINYITTKENFFYLLHSWPPKFNLTNNNDDVLSEMHSFNTKVLIDTNDNRSYFLQLHKIDNQEHFASVDVEMRLNEQEFTSLNDLKNDCFTLKPVVLDEVFYLAEMVHLETWKNDVKKLYESELEEMRNAQMENEKLLNFEKKPDPIILDSFVDQFRANLETYNNYASMDLVEKITKLELENKQMEKLYNEQLEINKCAEKTAFNKQKAVELLEELKVIEEKYANVQNAKKYFKEQWKEACDEVREMGVKEFEEKLKENDTNNELSSENDNGEEKSNDELNINHDLNVN